MTFGLSFAGKYPNVNYAISVNHPAFLLPYVKYVLPALRDLPNCAYPEPYMLPALIKYLEHHEEVLASEGLWQIAAEFISSRREVAAS